MPRFHKLLEQEYLKLDIKPEELSEIQKNLVDKMVSSEKAKYEGIKKMNAIISYDIDGKKGKLKIDPYGNIQKCNENEDEDQEELKGISKMTSGALTADDIKIAKILSGGTAKGGLLFNRNPQKQIEKAYGDIVGKIAKKLQKTASQIKI